MIPRWCGFAVGLCFVAAHLGAAANAGDEPTISSDVLELQNNGAVSVFRGHVVLKDPTYVLKAKRMSQVKSTGMIYASGQVNGVWQGSNGEHYHGTGEHASYDSTHKISELWQHAQVTRWETAVDTSPVVTDADHFVVDQASRTVTATGNVHITRAPATDVRSEQALYVDSEKALHLWGDQKVKVHYEDGKGGKMDFIGDRGLVTQDPKRIRLIDHVKGHVIPAP